MGGAGAHLVVLSPRPLSFSSLLLPEVRSFSPCVLFSRFERFGAGGRRRRAATDDRECREREERVAETHDRSSAKADRDAAAGRDGAGGHA